MRALKTILFLLYPILIVIVILSNLKGCYTPKNDFTDTTDVVKNAERIGRNGGLKVTLLWNFKGDIDLHVKQPNGREIYYNDKRDANTGGYLDVDNMEGGNGSAENIYWENPPKGKYTVSLVYYQPSRSTDIVGSGECTVVVFQQGKSPKTYRAHMSTVKETKKIINILIQ